MIGAQQHARQRRAVDRSVLLAVPPRSSAGFNMLLAGLAGDVVVLFIPSSRHRTEKVLGVLFTLLIFAGVYIEHVGDDAIAAKLRERATNAEGEVSRLKKARTLTSERQQFVIAATKPYSGQKFRASISQAADDGPTFWASLHAALTQAGWTYLPATSFSIGIPPAGIPIAAIPGVEIIFDPTREHDIGQAALVLGNALHADGMVVAVNKNTQANADPAERDVILVRIGARVPPP